MSLIMHLGGIDFNTGTVIDNAQWWITDLIGWDSPELRISQADLTSIHGIALGDTTWAGRSVSLVGVAKTTGGEIGFWNARNSLMKKLQISTDLTLQVDEKPIAKVLTVRLAGPIRMSLNPGNFQFEIPLVAPDPVKYSTVTSSSTVYGDYYDPLNSYAINNNGSFETYPVIQVITGGFNIVIGNRTLMTVGKTDESVVPPGLVFNHLPDNITIDMKKHTLTYADGISYYFALVQSKSSWWHLAPGTNVINVASSGGGPRPKMTVQFKNAWI
jgi:hypothetical protein